MNPSAEFMGWLVAGLTTLLGLSVMWRKFNNGSEPRAISPSPLVVTEAPCWVERKELDAVRVELIQRIVDHERRNESDMVLIRADLGGIRRGNNYLQRRMDGLTEVVYAIAGRLGVKHTPTNVPAEEGEG